MTKYTFAGESRPKKGKPATAEMQPAGLNLYPLPQGRLHKSTLNEIWQDQGVILLLLTGLFCHSAAYDGALTRSFKGAGAGGDFKEGKKMPAGSGQSEGTEVRSLSVQTAILDIGSAGGQFLYRSYTDNMKPMTPERKPPLRKK
ncbi:hypothetical protein [Rhizobium sp. P007]|uniref:hypothetical protein n=1 Tax=Rhizobium sp. P007 TaxID=285908 RepID=UPI00115A82E0|nr:hypothetical protein [Rhizobium sp. P007]